MKKLFAIAVLGLVLVSCKKSSSGGTSIPVIVNDTSYNFNILTAGEIYSGGKEIDIWGYDNTDASKAYELYFYFYSNDLIKAGDVFTDTATTSLSLPTIYRSLYVEYYPQLPVPGINKNFYEARLVSNPFKLTVTSVSTTSVQGTIQGTLYIGGDSTTTADSIKVINGKFNMPLVLTN